MGIKNRLLLLFKPIQIFMQRLGRKETIMTQKVVDMIQELVLPGDIALSYEAQRLTSIFIKGNLDHASIVTDTVTVMEAVGDDWEPDPNYDRLVNKGGVREVPLVEWLFKKDHVVIVRPKLPEITRFSAGKNSKTYKGRGYDYAFNYKNKAVYCSELILLSYREADPSFLKEVTKEILPIEYMDFTQSKPELFELIFDSRKELK